VFKNVTGLSFSQFADTRRLVQQKTRLQKGQAVTSALYDSGYSSTSRLYEKAPAQLGMTPNTYRKGGQNIEITYAVIDWSLGQILVAATDKGVCASRLGDDAANPVALVVPCHRVMRQVGGLGRYRWGLERKSALLEGESITESD
jgi:AraC family transcriptional regulator of adaptative response/methylated-DNA-[protein]-cysteine methyltransferase